MSIKKPSFEENYDIIVNEINKRKNKWTLTSVSWLDFDDVKQIILIHIYKKWKQYNPAKPLTPWIGMIITNQIRNLVRNNYTNYARPCLRCDAAIDSNGCKIYGEQCETCPLYAYWKKNKQPATFIKLPLSIENHTHELHEMKDGQGEVLEGEEKLRLVMKKILKPIEYKVYEGLYVHNKEESVVAKSLGFISNEKGRAPGYRQIRNLDKSLKEKAKKYITEHGLN